MGALKLWGIYREQSHSPGRESDDEAILDAVATRLTHMGLGEVRRLYPSELGEQDPATLPDGVFYMCEAGEVLDRLARWQARGAVLVNPVHGTRNTFRTETVRLLEQSPHFPGSRILHTDRPAPPFEGRQWVKRGDYHAVCAEDVVEVSTSAALASALAQFRSRGIPQVVLQEHVEGDLIKFYGVRDADAGLRWFKWFYHRDQVLAHHPVDELRLRQICEQAARALDLEVFGGDVIVTASGALFAIDVNAWPSFALFRDVAARHIAAHVARRLGVKLDAEDQPITARVANQ